MAVGGGGGLMKINTLNRVNIAQEKLLRAYSYILKLSSLHCGSTLVLAQSIGQKNCSF